MSSRLQQNPNFAREFLLNGCFFAIDSNQDEHVLLGWGPWKKSKAAGEKGCSVFTPDFYLEDEKPWRSPESFEVVSRKFFTSSVLPKLRSEVNSQIPEQGSESHRFQWVEPSLEGFEQQVLKIRTHFREGSLEKAVPVVHAQAREIMTQHRLVNILEKLVLASPSLIPSGFWTEGAHGRLSEGLLGATPERLFAIEAGGRLTTMALAGTRAKTSGDTAGETGTEDARLLFEDEKERYEHQLVIDDMRVRLSRFGRVEIGETFVAELPTLFHLKTSITVSEVSAPFETLAQALHPTPALGVSPRAFGLQNMREWDETKLRHRYGAPFGLSLRTPEFTIQDCLVAIRNVQWANAQAPTLGSGCGFLKQSEIEREWAELKLKRDSVKKVLNV